MIHLTEAIVGINKRPKKIGNGKTFGELIPGDTIYFYWGLRNADGEFTLDSIEDYKDPTGRADGAHWLRLGAGKDKSYVPYKYCLNFGDGWNWFVPDHASYMEISDDFGNPVMAVTTSKKEYEKFKKIYKIR